MLDDIVLVLSRRWFVYLSCEAGPAPIPKPSSLYTQTVILDPRTEASRDVR